MRDILSAISRKVSLADAKARFEALNKFSIYGGIPEAARADAVKLVAWSERLREEAGVHFGEYARFLNLANRCGWDLSDGKTAFPGAARFLDILERLEVQAEKLDKALESKEFRDGMKRARERYGSIRGMRDGVLSVEIPFSKKELQSEGRVMKNCIGRLGYAAKIARGDSLVVFIRRNGEPDADMEILLSGKTPSIVQLYSAENQKPTKDVESFSKKILKRVCKARKAGSAERG